MDSTRNTIVVFSQPLEKGVIKILHWDLLASQNVAYSYCTMTSYSELLNCFVEDSTVRTLLVVVSVCERIKRYTHAC